MPDLKQFDRYLADVGPAALVIREWLMPVEGPDGVLFPATFAAAEDRSKFAGGYNIDNFEGSLSAKFSYQPPGAERLETEVQRDPVKENVCLVDTVGSQANRIEPLFKEEKYKHLVPQIVVKAGEKEVSILDAGHRAGDALVRCSSLKDTIDTAFLSVLRGDCEPLAKLAPTSLVFGVWNSRGEQGTQAKLPRIVASTIRAFNVRKLTRSAQFNPATEYVNDKLLDEPTDKGTRDAYAERGFIHVPASGSHGGVIADGGVRRDATLGLAALRLLFSGKNEEKTRTLRRYILGLALTAFTHNPSGYLRQGCLLVRNPAKAKENEFVEVYPTGERKPVTIAHDDALKYATEAARAFGVGESKTVPFDPERAKRDVKGGAAEGDKAKGKISAVDVGAKKFTIGKGAKKVEITTSGETVYFKGDAESAFDAVVVKDATVEVELANGVAVKVTGK
jgi:CRISPR-associated protein Csb1